MVNIVATKSSQLSVNISKGLLYLFFSIYLVVFGVILTDFIELYKIENPGILPTFVSYLPFACYIGAIFLGISFLLFIKNTTTQKSRELSPTTMRSPARM